MAARESGTRGADMNVNVICTFHRGEAGFNGVSSIKTDIYFTLGCVWFAEMDAELRPDRRDRRFKTIHRLALECLFPSCPLMDRQIHGPGS